MKQRSARKTAHCRKASLKHGMYSATMYSVRAYLRSLANVLDGSEACLIALVDQRPPLEDCPAGKRVS